MVARIMIVATVVFKLILPLTYKFIEEKTKKRK